MRNAAVWQTLHRVNIVGYALADTWGMHDTGTGWWIVMLISMLAFWALVAAGVFWLIRQSSTPASTRSATTETAREILDRRLAAGDLSPAEYEQHRSLLEGSPGADGGRVDG